ncbi:hypothetical protein GCM10017608_01290 [Agromyces luteolus]|uniref:Uncharacterized protein n=1 Tax=Agromyces luteolus TaxID=88373 RepID=A0A7C9LX08_9MICO|nr:hypothetical protein [Agromyces luteolus]MUN05653.1 hypothetical protein [Agromyces luteolus]GLK26197.1 hypothetical protein GCM10017608_01290 [Agromyces luteolus]
MSEGDRIAELQRLAYGAGTDDAERAVAAAQLEEIRRGMVGAGAAKAVAGPAGSADERTVADAMDDDARAEFEELLAPVLTEGSGPPPATIGPSTVMRVAGVAAGIALAIGFAAGWATGANFAGAESIPGIPDSSLVFPLDEPEVAPAPAGVPGAGAAIPVEETAAFRIFDREPTAQDLDMDPNLFGHLGMAPDGSRLLVTDAGGSTVHVALTAAGDMCLAVRIDATQGMGACTSDGMFPGGEGLGMRSSVPGLGLYSAWLSADGTVAVSSGAE